MYLQPLFFPVVTSIAFSNNPGIYSLSFEPLGSLKYFRHLN